ncbi:MAG TPA: hypothetical protein PLH57_09050, partial [Oligoflexia bacterium]|nr:hypothetical protein [Oligoflexia bacterium]
MKFASGEERYFPALSRDGIGDSATLPHLDMDQKELGHAPPYELIPVGEYVSRSSADPRMLHRIQKELDHFEKVDAPFKGEFEYRLQRGARRLASDPERAQLLVEEVSGDLRLQRTIDELNARLVDPSERAITEGPLSLIEIEEARRFLKKRAKLKDDLIDALLDSGVVGRPGSYETIDVAAARIYGSGEKIAKGRPVIVIPRKGKSYSSNLEVIESVTIATNPVSGKKVVKDIKKVRDTEVVRSRDLDEVVLVDAQEYFANPRLRLPKESKLRADYDGILARQAIEKVKAAAKIAERAGGKKPAKAVYSDTHQELVVVRLKNGEVFVARNGRRAIADQKWTFEVEGNLQQLDEATGYKKGYVIYDSAEVAEVIPVRKLRPIDAWTDPKNKDLVDAFEKFDALPNRIRRARLRRAQILEDKLDAAKEAAKKRGETFTIEEQAKIEMQIARDFEVIRKIEEEILKNPKSKRAKAIDAAHRAGEVSDPPKALTKKQLKEKDKILIEGGLTAAERRALMDLGITGDELQSAFAPYVYINGVQYAKRYKDVIVVRTDGTIQLVNELGYVQGDLFSLNLFEINPRPMDEVIVYGKGFTVKAGEFSIVGIDDPIVFTDPRFARVRTLLEERTSIFGWAKSLNQEIVPPKSLTSEPVAFFPNAQGLQCDSAFGYE